VNFGLVVCLAVIAALIVAGCGWQGGFVGCDYRGRGPVTGVSELVGRRGGGLIACRAPLPGRWCVMSRAVFLADSNDITDCRWEVRRGR
jgi:hypothetical protein